MLGNPKFLIVLALEVVLGCTGKLISELNVRGDRFWKVGGPVRLTFSHRAQEELCSVTAALEGV